MTTKEIILKIDIACVPLKKHRYNFSEIHKRKEIKEKRSASQLLSSAYREREKREEEILKKKAEVDKTLLEEIKKTESETKIRKLQKPRFSIYDYSEIEHDQLEEDVAELINKDGYYDDIVPIDDEIEESPLKKLSLGKTVGIIALASLIVAVALFVIFTM